MFSRLRANEFICIWAIWNGLFLALLTVITVLGWTIPVIMADHSYLSFLILAIFFTAWAISLKQAVWINSAHKNIALWRQDYRDSISKTANHEDAREALISRLMRQIRHLDYVPKLLVLIGLVGTVIGLMIGTSDISPNMVGDMPAATRGMATMIRGLGVGFVATLVGTGGAIWIGFQEHLILGEITRLYERILVRD